MKSSNRFGKTYWVGLFIAGILAIPFTSLWAEETKEPAGHKEPVITPVAAEEQPTGDFTVTAMSQYFWRGYELSRNSVVIQPPMTVGYKRFAVTVTPTLAYIFPLSGDARDEMKGQGLKGSASPADRDSSVLCGGIAVSFSF